MNSLSRQIKIFMDVSQTLTSTLSLQEVLQKAVDLVVKQMGYYGCVLFRVDEQQQRIYSATISRTWYINIALKFTNIPFEQHHVSLVKDKNNFIVRSVLDNKPYASEHLRDILVPAVPTRVANLMQEVTGLGASLAMPICYRHKTIGAVMFASKKKTDFQEDLPILNAFASQLAIAIENARLFQQTQDQLEEIKQQYDDLQTIQDITNSISTIYDFKTLAQKIVDAIPTRLGEAYGYLGGMIVMRENGSDTYRAYAISTSKLSDKVLRLLPESFKEYAFNATKDHHKNEALVAVLQKHTHYISEHLEDFIYPPIPKILARKIQKMSRMKSATMCPVVVKGQLVGTILFFLGIPTSQITEKKLKFMQSFGDQISIAINNVHSYEELREAKEHLEEAYRDLQQLDEAKTRFMTIASHQLRTPLTALEGYLSLTLDRFFGSLTDEQHKTLDKMDDNVRRLRVMIDDLLNLARMESGVGLKDLTLEEFDIVALISDIIDDLTLNARDKGIELRNKLPHTKLMIKADRQKIENIVMNIVDNAVLYTPSGWVDVRLQEEKQWIVISVRDSGIGIDKEQQKNIFSKFYRAADAIKIRPDGTGIGLYIVQLMVQAQSGQVWLESRKGKGTTFFVKLPRQLRDKIS
jgi:signal transduction histidine kinase